MNLQKIKESDLRQIDIVKIYADKKCLVVDDFPEIRGSLSRMLRIFGASVVDTAANGEDAIGLCRKKKYDIVLCDYNLGAGKDGQQVLEELRLLRILLMTSLFVMVTGESSREMVLGALECQPDDYITKPYTQASLKVRMDKAIIRHQALLPIKKAISDSDYQKALEICDDMINEGGRYNTECVKMKGQLHFMLGEFEHAKTLFESVLSRKPLVWAKLGLSRTLKELGDDIAAEALCREIIAEDERYVEAHELLAEIFEARRDSIAAQKATESATSISPKSVLRHRKLAQLSEQNHDDDIALKSHQQAIKWGANSCHESEQDYFNYARKISDVIKGDKSTQAKVMAKQATSYLDRARKRYAGKPEIAAQAQMVETQIHLSRGSEEDASKSMKKARQLYAGLPTPNVDTSLEFARTLHALQNHDEARDLLVTLAAEHSADSKVLQVIDGITDEPISQAGKEVAAKLTKEGISSYDQKVYGDAIKVFNEALANYPKHIGLHLNLIQAITADTSESGYREDYAAMCKRSIRVVGALPQGHKQYERYQFLHKQLQKHYPEVVT